MKLYSPVRRSRRGEQGYLLLMVLFLITLLVIASLAAAPSIVGQIKHDREVELVHRGAEYARAIKKFYKKFGQYPVSLDQLDNTNQIRFLRKRYKDPITGADFRLLHVGEVKITSGNTTLNIGTPAQNLGGAQSSSAAQGATIFGGAPISSIFGGSAASSTPSTSTSAQGNSSSAGTSTSGSTFGSAAVGPIIGVESKSKLQSMMEFNKKDHYNEWEFIYDPSLDRGGLIKGPFNGMPPAIAAASTPAQGAAAANTTGNTQSPTSAQPASSPQPAPFGSSTPTGNTTSPSPNPQ